MEKQELELNRKLAELEFLNDQLMAEFEYLNDLLKAVGFPQGLISVKMVAEEMIEGTCEEN